MLKMNERATTVCHYVELCVHLHKYVYWVLFFFLTVLYNAPSLR